MKFKEILAELFFLAINFCLHRVVEGGVPVFSNINATGTIVSPGIRDDATVSANFYTSSCSDTTGGLPVTFQITSVQPYNPVFQITPYSGVLSYNVLLAQGTPMFDYSTAPNYFLTIVCSQAGFSTSVTLTVPIQQINKAPIFYTPVITYTTVPENTLLPLVVFTNSAYDPQGLSITYSADSVGTYKNANFKTDNFGRVYLIPNTNLNASWTNVYYVNELAYNIYRTSSISLTVSVIGVNHAPSFTNLPNLAQVFEQTTSSTQFFKLNWRDEDDPALTGTYGFTFTSNPSSGTSKFSIDSNGNVWTLPQPAFDTSYEPTFVMTIYLTDAGSPQYTTTGTLTVNIIPQPTTKATSTTLGVNAVTTSTVPTTTLNQAMDTTTLIAIVCGTIGGVLVIGGVIGIAMWCMRSTSNQGGIIYQTGSLLGNNASVGPAQNPTNGREIIVQGLNKQLAPPPPYRP